MTTGRLHHNHSSVVHSSTHRTRLRIPKNKRNRDHLLPAQKAIEKLPGVQSVEVNPETGSLLIHHDSRPDILNEVSSALQASAPEILAALLIPGAEEAEIGLGVIANLFKTCVLKPLAGATGNGSAENGSSSEVEPFGVDFPANNSTLKLALPLAFVAAGAWKLMQDEALLAGLAPIACFYYGFDLYWRFRQENVQSRIEDTTLSLNSKAVEQPANKPIAESK